MTGNPELPSQTTDPRTSGGGVGKEIKGPAWPPLFTMAIKNSNQMKTHKKLRVLEGRKAFLSVVLGQALQRPEAGVLVSKEPKSTLLVWGVGSGFEDDLNPQELLEVG